MRNEDYDRELLVAVTLICVAIAGGASIVLPTTPSANAIANSIVKASAQTPPRIDQLEPVRVIGAPFVLNTNPRER